MGPTEASRQCRLVSPLSVLKLPCSCTRQGWIVNIISKSFKMIRLLNVGSEQELVLAGRTTHGKENALNQGTGIFEVGSSGIHSMVVRVRVKDMDAYKNSAYISCE